MNNVLTLNIPWIESPLFPSLLQHADLSVQQKKMCHRFAEEGYIVLDFPSEDIPIFADEIRDVLFKRGPAVHNRLQDGWKTCSAIRDIAVHPSILATLRLLYRREPIPFQTLNFPIGTQQATHSDTIHFHCVPHRFMCGVWVALEDIDENNGPFHVYPGSHKLPIWDMHDLGLSSGRESYRQYEAAIRTLAMELNLPKKTVYMKKGQAIIWAANLLHGGEAIRDPKRTRLSQVTHYFFENCLYYTPMHSDPYLGKVAMREITNILDGTNVPNVYNGVVVPFKEQELNAALPKKTPHRVPHRHDIFRMIPRGGIGCELGVLRGDLTKNILRIAEPTTLHLVDIWEGPYVILDPLVSDKDDIPVWDTQWQERHLSGDDAWRIVHSRFASQIGSGQIQIHRQHSVDFLTSLPDRSLDWIYIDADHAYESVSRELALARRKVRSGGWIMGHDYCTVLPGVIRAVDEFCERHKLQIDMLTNEQELPVFPHRPPLPEHCAFNSFAIRNVFLRKSLPILRTFARLGRRCHVLRL